MIVTVKEALEILQKTKSLLEQGWTKGASARDKYGKICNVYDMYATSYCLVGSLNLATIGSVTCYLSLERHIQVANNLERDELTVYNDSHTKEEVIALLDKAIATVSSNPEFTA